MGEENMNSWSGAQRQNLSVVIYHTLFSHREERFHHTGINTEKEREKRETELEIFILQGLWFRFSQKPVYITTSPY